MYVNSGRDLSRATIRIFYGSSTGNTQRVAQLIQRELNELVLSIGSIADAKPDDLNSAPALILGVSTWDDGELQGDWKRFFPAMDQLELTGKKVALFGLGNAAGFSGEFVTALGTLYAKVKERGANVVGFWPSDGYHFYQSGALLGDHFVGLVIDEDTESKKTAERVQQWTKLIRPEFCKSGKDSNGPPISNPNEAT